MIKKLLYYLLLKWYIRQNREIIKLSLEEEFKCFLFREPDDVEKLLRANLTVQTVKYFEAQSETERLLIKGAALQLQILKDAHLVAMDLKNKFDVDKQMQLWKKFKIGNKIN